jgi:heme/copper-type cytochrome/quinol oxidase subunit 2
MNLSLAEAIFWIAALACIAAQTALLRSGFSIRQETKSELVPASPRSIELTWAVVPALILFVLLFATWRKVAEREEHRGMDHSTIGPTASRSIDRLPTPGV